MTKEERKLLHAFLYGVSKETLARIINDKKRPSLTEKVLANVNSSLHRSGEYSEQRWQGFNYSSRRYGYR